MLLYLCSNLTRTCRQFVSACFEMECGDNFCDVLENTWKNIEKEWPYMTSKHFKNFVNFATNKHVQERKMDDQFKCKLVNALFDWVISMLQYIIETNLYIRFWYFFKDEYDGDSFLRFPKAMSIAYLDMKKFIEIAEYTQKLSAVSANQTKPFQRNYRQRCLRKEMLLQLRTSLFSDCFYDFDSALTQYYNIAFRVFHGKQKGSPCVVNVGDGLICYGCGQKPRSCCCEEYLLAFYQANQQMRELHILDHLVKDIPITVAQENVEQHIHETCVKKYEVSFLPILKNWLEETPLKWLAAIYGAEGDSFPSLKTRIDAFRGRLLHVLYNSYADVRLEQLFNIIIEFPDSKAAIDDLRECISVADLRPKLVSELKGTIKKRLLHPGVNTADILTAYISCIKALRVLDNSSVILQLVGEPVCKYLRSRDDTVRCIVSSLTDDSCEDLATELVKNLPLVLQDDYVSDEENENWESWKPDPIDADPSRAAKAQRSSDIISMLVNIYGTKEVFVNEYRTLLADRLLNSFSFNTKKEIRYLELLKLRFGESQMHYCDVMLKDVADSKRINTRLNCEDVPELKECDFLVNAMILSAQFWPPFKEEKFRLPEYIWKQLKKYTSAFEALKGNRTLVWKPHLGQINLEIELKEKTLELSVSPIHATILWYFQDKPEWTVSELCNVMQMQASLLRRKITFWQSHGILREREPDVFTLVEEHKGNKRESIVMIEEEMESVAASSHDQREEELQTFWSYIVGMLTNMDSLPLERIHSMLRMFAMQGTNTNEFTLQGMKQFLDKKVKDRQLVYSGGLYRLPRGES